MNVDSFETSEREDPQRDPANDQDDRFTWSADTPLTVISPGTLEHAILEAFLELGGVQKSESIVNWMSKHFPDKWIARKIRAHIRACSVNQPIAIKCHPNTPRFLCNVRIGEFELYKPDKHGEFDKSGLPIGLLSKSLEQAVDKEADQFEPSAEFALEAHLRDYLVSNLQTLEKGLSLWDNNPPSVECKVESRRIDILARDVDGIPVVIELKVGKSYDRVIGQALLYRGLVAKSLDVQRVRIILVASTVSDELKIATAGLNDVLLVEYSISFQTKVVGYPAQEGI